jgi:hypothetical protein
MSAPAAPSSADGVIAAVCFLGTGSSPLFFRAYAPYAGSLAALQLELAVFSALDVLDERVPERRVPPLPSSPSACGFLGLLLHVEEFKVFGFATATSSRIVVVVRDVLLREDRMRELFSQLHRCYAAAVASPFAAEGAPLSGAAFEREVARVVRAAGPQILYQGATPF